MSICFGRVTPMDGVSYTWPYLSFVSTASAQSILIPHSTMHLEDKSNCQAGYE